MTANTDNMLSSTKITGRVLVVDDDRVTQLFHLKSLRARFEVKAASSGKEALQIFSEFLPDLVLLDANMPEMDGYETCTKLRELSDIPIIFVTASESAEDHLKVFNVGGDDVILKPASPAVLLRKVELAIARKNEQLKLIDTFKVVKSEFLSAVGEKGILQKFMRSCLNCRSISELTTQLANAIKELGLDNCVLIRNNDEPFIKSSHGEPSAIELSILKQSNNMENTFQFKQRLVIHKEHVSAIVTNMPVNDLQSDRLRDNIEMLVELTESMCNHVNMRASANLRTELLQSAMYITYTETDILDKVRQTVQSDIRLLLQELIDNVEKTYNWLGVSNSQEATLNKTMHESVEKILALMETSRVKYDAGFEKILSSVKPSDLQKEMYLF